MKDYYNILGVSKNATYYDIAQAYKVLSLKYNPKINEGNDELKEKFNQIQEAYETLSNGKKRNEHDQYLSQLEKIIVEKKQALEPEIEYFTSDKYEIKYGDEITLKWRALNADHAVLKPFGQVQATGTYTYKIKDFSSKSLPFELIAENATSGKSSRAVVTIKNNSYDDYKDFYNKEIEKQRQEKEVKEVKDVKEEVIPEKYITNSAPVFKEEKSYIPPVQTSIPKNEVEKPVILKENEPASASSKKEEGPNIMMIVMGLVLFLGFAALIYLGFFL